MKYAMKIFQRPYGLATSTWNKKVVSRVRAEYELMKDYRSEYVIEYYDFLENVTWQKANGERVQDVCALVLEYVDGTDLYDFVNSKSVILAEDGLRCMFQKVVRGIIEFHDRGILHGDIKLENIMISKDFKIRFIDFNRSVRLDTTHTQVIGTPGHIAPDTPYHSAPADVFAFGVSLYRACTKSMPSITRSTDTALSFSIENDTNLSDENMSFNLKDLIRLTVVSADQRISMPHVVKHPWLAEDRKDCEQKVMDEAFKYIRIVKKSKRVTADHIDDTINLFTAKENYV